MRVLAIDQGTTSTRALIVDDAGVRLAHGLSHRQIYPASGRVEHDPEELVAAIRACLAAAPDTDCVGLDNQGESCLAWDAATGAAVSPVIVWQDARTEGECARLKAEGAETLSLARAGLPLDPYFSAAKLGWILREIPAARDLLARGRLRLGTTDAFFRDRLTGRFATDPTTASRTGLMDLGSLQWDADLCALFGVPMECLPEILPTTGDLGRLPDGRPLTASVTDQQAALYGHGCRRPGDAKITFGSGAFALVLTEAPRAGGGLLPTVAWAEAGRPAVYALDGGVYTASSAVNWARDLGLFDDWAQINAFDAGPAIGRGLAFVPALAGLAAPHWDRAARGAWLGLGLDHSSRDMAQAVLEGVAFRMAEVIGTMAALTPITGAISIDGGMSRNPWFTQFLADVLDRPIRVSAEAELTGLGCAQLAAAGAGGRLDPPRPGREIAPRAIPAAWRARFAAARQAVTDYGAAGV